MPSPFPSANDRGYTWYTTARVHHGASSGVQLMRPILARAGPRRPFAAVHDGAGDDPPPAPSASSLDRPPRDAGDDPPLRHDVDDEQRDHGQQVGREGHRV